MLSGFCPIAFVSMMDECGGFPDGGSISLFLSNHSLYDHPYYRRRQELRTMALYNNLILKRDVAQLSYIVCDVAFRHDSSTIEL